MVNVTFSFPHLMQRRRIHSGAYDMSLSKHENKVINDGIPYYGGVNQPRHFLKVNVDSWEKIFDYLSFRDMLAMSQTCQRVRQIGGYYFRQNFHETVCRLDGSRAPYFFMIFRTLHLKTMIFCGLSIQYKFSKQPNERVIIYAPI